MNNSDNNELNSISLGNVDNHLNTSIPPVAPIPEETLDPIGMNSGDASMGMVNQNGNDSPSSFNGNGSIPTPAVAPVEPVAPVSYDVPEPIQNFGTTPVFNDIGTIPPIENVPVAPAPMMEDKSPKKKPRMNKTLFVLIVILALTAVGVAVYIFLNMANTPKNFVQTKNMEVEIGSVLSTTITDYATFKGISSSNCSLDTASVKDTSTLNAEYTYKIICGENSYTGKITIVDKVAPEVKIQEVTVGVNGEVSASDFILECIDATACSYAFKDESKVKEYLKTAENYHVDLIVTDEAGNQTEVTGTMIVNESAVASVYLVCTKDNSSYLETNRFGLVESQFNKVTTRSYTFTFSETDYNTFKTNNSGQSDVTYGGITGKATFDDTNYTLTITKNVSYSDLNTEVGSTVPLSYADLNSLFTERGYSCGVGF